MTDESKYPDIDRRIAKRKRSQLTMRYWVKGHPESSMQSVSTVDISAKSVLFEAFDLIASGTEMRMELDLPSHDEPIHAEGWINRIEVKEKGKRYFYCLLFDEITEEDQNRLAKYIQLIDVENLLKLAVDREASDVHLMAGKPPVFRIEGELEPLDLPPISSQDLKFMIMPMMTQKQRRRFEERLEMNFSYLIPDGIRFRVNVHFEKGNVEAALRIIPSQIKPFDELGLPAAMDELAGKTKGLVIISGPTGSGKTTTLASLVDSINSNRNCMIISIEDPIEYVHESKKSLVKQREVGSDTLSFNEGLRNILRQDPNVIFIGELRDTESVNMAITAAETGHLVLSTMHTMDTVECINRIVDAFPAEQHDQVRSRLSQCLAGIMSQVLLPRKDGHGRVVATEVLIATHTLRKLIREGQHDKSMSYEEAGLRLGMHMLDESLKELVKKELVDQVVATGYSKNPDQFKRDLVRI